VVRKGGAQKLVKIPLGQEALKAKVQAFMQPLINAQGVGFSMAKAKELYDLLFAPAEVKETERVIVVPDGILGLLPFEALVITPGTGEKDTVYVGDRFQVSYYQSATVLALQRGLKSAAAKRTLFALGNPVFNDKDPRYVAYRAGRKLQPATLAVLGQFSFRGLATRREWGKTSQEDKVGKELVFPPLPETEREVKEVAKLLGVEARPPDVLVGVAANETGLRKAPLGEYRYLHFATHADLPGVVQGIKEPFILLGQVDNRPGDDGFLTMSEVFGLKLNAELAVLSACVTGRGEVMEGEGVANFARAFHHAGVRGVVVSLWEVATEPAVEYMTAFYSHLKSGKSRLEALRLARQALKAKYPNPFFWAVFILHGEG
jgi:CHAT domain-containing protein